MSIDDEFIQTIIANPDDDIPRLVYADWLDEQADPRGEFIRIQCELAMMAEEDPRRWDLELRQGRLLRWYGWQWWHEPFAPDATRPIFRRGFPEEFELNFTELERKFSSIFRAYPLFRFLTVHCDDSPSQIAQLVGRFTLSRLVRLEIQIAGPWNLGVTVGQDICLALANCRQLQSLKHLELLADSFHAGGQQALRGAFGERLCLRRYSD